MKWTIDVNFHGVKGGAQAPALIETNTEEEALKLAEKYVKDTWHTGHLWWKKPKFVFTIHKATNEEIKARKSMEFRKMLW
jgi:hypothetical protein